MSDEADATQDRLDNEGEIKRKYYQPPKLEAEAVGKCLNCYEPVGLGVRWCSKDCAIDWTARQPRSK